MDIKGVYYLKSKVKYTGYYAYMINNNDKKGK